MLRDTQVFRPALRAATAHKTAPFDLRPPPVESTICLSSAYTQPIGKYGPTARTRQGFPPKSNNALTGIVSELPSLNDTQMAHLGTNSANSTIRRIN